MSYYIISNIKTVVNFLSRRAVILSVAAALLYNSWPLGFWLNYSTTMHGLASDLEQIHHPYSWVFISGDLLSSLIILVLCLAILVIATSKQKNAIKIIASGLIIFAVFTVVATLLPSECSITPILKCRVIEDSGLGVDALTSTIAAIGLSVSILGLVYLDKLRKINDLAHHITLLTLTSWALTGLLFIYQGVANKSVRIVEWLLLILSGVIIILSFYYIKHFTED